MQYQRILDPSASGGMVYTADLKSAAREGLRVQVPPRRPIKFYKYKAIK